MILTAILTYQIYYGAMIGYYQRWNYHRALPYAIQKEKEWLANKPDDDDDELWGDDDEDEDDEEEGADEEGGDDEGDDDE